MIPHYVPVYYKPKITFLLFFFREMFENMQNLLVSGCCQSSSSSSAIFNDYDLLDSLQIFYNSVLNCGTE